MLRRAKSFFIKRKKHAESQGLPAECLTEKSHLARKPIIVDAGRRLVSFKEPPDVPDLNTMVRSSTQLGETVEKEVELRPANFRRRSRPKTVDVSLGRAGRLSFPPSSGDHLEKPRSRTSSESKKLANQ